MIEVLFLNVDQGDSIILKWETKEGFKFGIVDSNLVNDTRNRTKEYLINEKIESIEFVILSHPHDDHYSGLEGVLQYCFEKKIPIKNFYHTAYNTPEYLQAAVDSAAGAIKLIKLFTFIRDHRKAMNMNVKVIEYDIDRPIHLSDELEMYVLSPSENEREDYVKKVLPKIIEETGANNPNANFLSTILKIIPKAKDWYVLLTADAEIRSFRRILKHKDIPSQEAVILGQIPHHGASHNHNKKFWQGINKNNNPNAVVSVGRNHYKHPVPSVIKFFKDERFKVYSTQQKGIHINYPSKDMSEKEKALSSFSQLVFDINRMAESDKLFHITANGVLSEGSSKTTS